MEDRVIVGIGGAGCAIAAHINCRTGDSLNIHIIENNCVPRETTLPIHYISEGIYTDDVLLDTFLTAIIAKQVSRMIIVSGFNGLAKDVVPIVKRYADSRGIQCTLAGVTPFNFEGTKKNSDTLESIHALQAQNINVVTFSNNDLLSVITPTTSLQEAIKINYDKILQEVVVPHYPELEVVSCDDEPLHYRVKKAPIVQEQIETVYANPMTVPEKRSRSEVVAITLISILFIIIALLAITILVLSVSFV